MALKRFTTNSRPRGKLKQYSAQQPYSSSMRAIEQRLLNYEAVYQYDNTINSTIELLVESLVSSLGEVEHPDEEVQEFLRKNINRMSNHHQVNFYQEMKQVLKATLWGGFSVTENLYEKHDNQMKLMGFSHLHPTSIILRTNKRGQLVEGEPSMDPVFSSGIWQRATLADINTSHYGEIQVPMWKTTLLTHNKEFNNYYGRSIVESCYRWHVIKEALMDMFLVAQDQHGNPLTVMMVPNGYTGETIWDPNTQEERQLSVMESLERQFNSISTQDGNILMVPFADKDSKPDVKVIGNTADVAQGYLSTLKFCDQQIVRALLVPHTIVDSNSVDNAELAERDMEMFNRTLQTIHQNLVVPFVNKSLGTLVLENFTEDAHEFMPSIPLRNIMRPEDRVSMMQFIRGLTELGYFNPMDKADRHMIRSWVGAIEREMSKEDVQWIERFLLQPREKSPGGDSTSATPKNRNSRSNTRDRSNEGTVKGSGKPGRPTGKATPAVRDKNKRASA